MTVYEDIIQGLEEAVAYNENKTNKIDCSNILNYQKEFLRMCDSYLNQGNHPHCQGCPIIDICFDTIGDITQEHIDAVQKWSNKHQAETNKDYFFKTFPNAPKTNGNYPVLCVRNAGLKQAGERCKSNCSDCWDELYKGE